MPGTVLLVHPDTIHRGQWQELLCQGGCQVLFAHDGQSAVDACSQLQPDLVLLHSALPDLCSIEVSKRIKTEQRNRLTVVALLGAGTNLQGNSFEFGSVVDDVLDDRLKPQEQITRLISLANFKSYIDRQAEAVVFSLARSIEARDFHLEGHGERVARYAVRLGEALNLPEGELGALRVAAVVHDVGKVAVPDSILTKPGKLTAEERQMVNQHPIVGEEICAPIKSFRDILPIVRHHHERLDGSGYPDGLKGESIPLTVRILQIADIYDALTTDRPYRRAYSHRMAIVQMWGEVSRGRLDGALVRKLRDLTTGLASLTSEMSLLREKAPVCVSESTDIEN